MENTLPQTAVIQQMGATAGPLNADLIETGVFPVYPDDEQTGHKFLFADYAGAKRNQCILVLHESLLSHLRESLEPIHLPDLPILHAADLLNELGEHAYLEAVERALMLPSKRRQIIRG